jgi:hypothetical protein
MVRAWRKEQFSHCLKGASYFTLLFFISSFQPNSLNFLPLLHGYLMDPMQNIYDKLALNYLELSHVCFFFWKTKHGLNKLDNKFIILHSQNFIYIYITNKKITYVLITKDMNKHDWISCWATQSHGKNCLWMSIVQSLVLWIPKPDGLSRFVFSLQ